MDKLFHEVQEMLDIEFDKAPVKSKGWNYVITANKFIHQPILLVGFNWGLYKEPDERNKNNQKIMPESTFKGSYNELGSFKRVYTKLSDTKKFPLVAFERIVQTNFCLFSSKEENQITNADLALSIPIFHKLLNGLEPEIIVCFSARARAHFIKENYKRNDYIEINSGKKRLFVEYGTYNQTPVFFLPHPNSKFQKQAVEEAWELFFKFFQENNKRL